MRRRGLVHDVNFGQVIQGKSNFFGWRARYLLCLLMGLLFAWPAGGLWGDPWAGFYMEATVEEEAVPCPDATIDVEIFTDGFGSETTWEVVEQGTGTVVGSGGPYANNTLYNTQVCVDSSGCYDFIIYDAYSDGICCDYGFGHYDVYYEGGLVGSGGEFGSSETVSNLGGGCSPPQEGACCVEGDCVATNTETECTALGGNWHELEDCNSFTCPDEACADAIYSNGWYDKVNALHNCRFDDNSHDYRIVDDVTFTTEVTIQDLHWWGNEPVGFHWSGQAADYVILADNAGAPGVEITSGNAVAATRINTGDAMFGDPVWFYSIVGLNIPLPSGTYWVGMRPVQNQPYGTGPFDHGWWATAPNNGTAIYYIDDGSGGGFVPGSLPYEAMAFCITGEAEPCLPLDCPLEGKIEQETCGDDTNGGCNMGTPTFEPINCGETVCGTAWADGGFRDTDWYELNLPEPNEGSCGEIVWTVESQFPSVVLIINDQCDDSLEILALGYGYCGQPVSVSALVTAPGTYRLFVATGAASGGIYDGIDCLSGNNDYLATVTCNACPPPDIRIDPNSLLFDCTSEENQQLIGFGGLSTRATASANAIVATRSNALALVSDIAVQDRFPQGRLPWASKRYQTKSLSANSSGTVDKLFTVGQPLSDVEGIDAATVIDVSQEGLAALIMNQSVGMVLRDVPVSRDKTADFVLRPFDVFSGDAKIVEFDGKKSTAIERPDVSMFTGTCLSNPEMDIYLSVTQGDEVWVMIRSQSRAISFIVPMVSVKGAASHVLVEGVSWKMKGNFCSADLLPENEFALNAFLQAGEPVVLESTGSLETEVMVDLNYGLYTNDFGSNSTTATTYVTNLFGASSAIYRRDVDVCLVISELYVWITPDPFAAADSVGQLNNYRDYCVANRVGVQRDIAHLLADLAGGGGIAWLDVLCDTSIGYAVSNIHADVVFPPSGYEWDIMVVTHEIGHNFGSPHTHCYSPLIDCCYDTECFCTQQWVLGTIMSYCHLGPIGSEMIFHDRVKDVIRAGAEAAACVVSGCVSECDGQTVTIYNDGAGLLEVSSIETPNWITLVPEPPYSIPPGSSQEVCVQFDCSDCAESDMNATLNVYSNDPYKSPYPYGIYINVDCPSCGNWGYFRGDLNFDCYVNLKDMAILALDWLLCSHPDDPMCQPATP